MANSRFFCALAPVACALLVTSCAPAQSPEDADSASANSTQRDSSGQSYAEAIATVCDADRLAGVDESDPLGAAKLREDYLIEHVKNADGIYFLTVFRSKPAAEQAESLAREATATKVTRCPLVDTLRAGGGAEAARPAASQGPANG
jgi:hypothetical protein